MRTKTVFPTNEIAHLWMSQAQETAKNPGGNLFFDGVNIYSYGRHYTIATLVQAADGQQVVLFNPDNYSSTTNKHKSLVSRAIPSGTPVVKVPSFGQGYFAHRQNLQYLLNDLEEYQRKQVRSKTTDYTALAHGMAQEVDRYLAFFPAASECLNDPFSERGGVLESLAERLERARTWELTPEQREAFAAKVARHTASQPVYTPYVSVNDPEKEAEFFADGGRAERWLAGTPLQLSYTEQNWLAQNGNGTRLQLTDDGATVRTSQGAAVPAEEAKKLLCFVLAVVASGRAVRPMSRKIGSYVVAEVAADGTLTVGCHTLLLPEIERFAALVGWTCPE